MFFKGKYVHIKDYNEFLITDWPQLIKDMGREDDRNLNADDVIAFIVKNKPKYAKRQRDYGFTAFGKDIIEWLMQEKRILWKNLKK